MWAIGVITYILMSGIMPFDDDCRSRLYTHIITADYIYYPMVVKFFKNFYRIIKYVFLKICFLNKLLNNSNNKLIYC